MELNIPNPEAIETPEALGISPERQQELSKKLDDMVLRYDREACLVRTHHTMADVALFCDNNRELLYCWTLHLGLLQRRGHQIAPR